MTIAEQLKVCLDWTGASFINLLIEANFTGEAYEQDYENELTYFEFPDKSVAVFDGKSQTISTYGCKEITGE